MSRHWLIGLAVAIILVPLGRDPSPVAASTIEPAISERVARGAVLPDTADTVRTSTTVGTPLILTLPARVDNKAVSQYRIIKAPALAGVADRSFTWIPTGTPPGTYGVRLEARHAEGRPDTIVVQIRLEQ